MALADELGRLTALHRDGALTDEEFAKAKAALLSVPPDVSGRPPEASVGPPPLPRTSPTADDDDDGDVGAGSRRRDPAAVERDVRQWGAYIHFSMLAGLALPIAGYVLPFVLWQMKRVELPGVDAHGKVVVNWMISALIYGAVATVLAFVLVGIPLLIVLAVLMIVFPIAGGVKAGNGEVWRYPLTLPFVR